MEPRQLDEPLLRRMKHSFDPRISELDRRGVPYGRRLKQFRESFGKSLQEFAALADIPLPVYYDMEEHPGMLNRQTSLAELSRVASILGIPTRRIFDEEPGPGARIEPEELCARVIAYLEAKGVNVEEFEDRVGFEIQPALHDAKKVLAWNLDCLRSVCTEIGLDWRLSLP